VLLEQSKHNKKIVQKESKDIIFKKITGAFFSKGKCL
jgi:hypothetical protein